MSWGTCQFSCSGGWEVSTKPSRPIKGPVPGNYCRAWNHWHSFSSLSQLILASGNLTAALISVLSKIWVVMFPLNLWAIPHSSSKFLFAYISQSWFLLTAAKECWLVSWGKGTKQKSSPWITSIILNLLKRISSWVIEALWKWGISNIYGYFLCSRHFSEHLQVLFNLQNDHFG